MKLNEILDMKEYLQDRCYCAGEIYDLSGFFYQVFNADDECFTLAENENIVSVVCKDQILYIYKNEDNKTINDISRVDATENNIKIIKEIIMGKEQSAKLDEFKKGSTQRSLNEIMKIADAILID